MARVVADLGLVAFPQHTEGDVVVERSRFEPVQRFPTLPQEPRSMRLAGGTSALVSALRDALPAGQLHLGTPVSRVALLDGGVVLSCRGGETGGELVARQLILALPPRLLASTIDFEPGIDDDTLLRWRQTATWMAPHAKFFALYDRRSGASTASLARPRAA